MTARTDYESDIRSRSDKDETSTGKKLSGWTAYIHNTHGDRDARGKSYNGYRAEIVADGRDPDSPKTHGHHIVFKKSAAGGAGEAYAQEAKDILLYYGLDPYFGKENLAYAPNQGHSPITLKHIRDLLLQEKSESSSVTRIKNVLKTIAKDYIDKQLPLQRK